MAGLDAVNRVFGADFPPVNGAVSAGAEGIYMRAGSLPGRVPGRRGISPGGPGVDRSGLLGLFRGLGVVFRSGQGNAAVAAAGSTGFVVVPQLGQIAAWAAASASGPNSGFHSKPAACSD